MIEFRLKGRVLVIALIIGLSSGSVFGQQAAPVKKETTGTLTGRVLVKGGEPLSWGEVMFYDVSTGPVPQPEQYDRTPDISKGIDADGRFKITVPAGKYYLGAIKRMSGDRFGPPQEGDYVLLSVDENKKLRTIDVKAGSTVDIGTLSEAAPVHAKDLKRKPVTTGFQGLVMDTEGRPVSDAVVLAFLDPSLKGKPLFISEKTGQNGRYTLRVTQGTYYLRVRNSFAGGPPEPGQIVGYYGDGTPAPITVKNNEVIKNIDFRVIVFAGRGPRSGK